MNKKDIEKKIYSVIDSRRDKANKLAESNLQKALEMNDFKKAYLKHRELVFEIAKNEHLGNSTEAMRKQMASQKVAMKTALKELNLQKADLEPNYYCKKCNDTGKVDGYKCQCYKTLYSKELLTLSGRDENTLATFDKADFNVFDKEQQETMKKRYKLMHEYSANLKKTTKKIVTFIGETGVGKTNLAECMAKNAIDNGYYTVYTTSIHLGQEFLKYHVAPVAQKKYLLNNYLYSDMLVIDDLGTEPVLNNVTQEYLYLIISERLLNAKNTVITTNLDLDSIRQVYGDRIFSRIADQRQGLLYNFDGADIRLKK